MKSAIETMIGIIVLSLMAVLGASFITASLSDQRARSYHASVVQELQNSNFSPEVIENVKEKAAENGYENLEILVHENAETDSSYATVTLTYNYSIPILGQSKTLEITKDAI